MITNVTYVSSNQFKVPGDETYAFRRDVLIQMWDSGRSIVSDRVYDVSYDSENDETTVTTRNNRVSSDIGRVQTGFEYIDEIYRKRRTDLCMWFDFLKFGLQDQISGNFMSLVRDGSLTYLDQWDIYRTVPADVPAIGKHGLFTDGAGTQYHVNPDNPQTQNISLPTGDFCLWIAGTGSAEIAANTATIDAGGTATDDSPVVFNVSGAGTVDVTITGTVEWCQLETGTFPSSRIYNPGTLGDGSTASRATQAADSSGNGLSIDLDLLDSRVLTALGNEGNGEGTMICEIRIPIAEDAWDDSGLITFVDRRPNILSTWTRDTVNSYDSTNVVSDSNFWDRNKLSKTAIRWSGSTLELFRKKEDESTWTVNSGSFDGAFDIETHLKLFYGNEYPMWLRNLRLYNKALTEDEIEREVG